MKHALPIAALPLLLACVAAPALAQYKVIGSDGSVTYTDRPPIASNARITSLNRRGEAQATTDAGLPFDLRQATTRFPVTLYTSADCPPCDSGRVILQQRGVPFNERRVSSEDDAAALERAVGGRTVPALTIGSQALRGLSQTDWTSYLDAAGYPRESRLPRNFQPAAPTPLVERATGARVAGNVSPTPLVAEPAPAASAPTPVPPAEPQPGIRF